jgi:XRN 5'-3' exonuclease N-terminus
MESSILVPIQKTGKKVKILIVSRALILTFSMNRPAPKNEDEMMVAIFEFIDRIFAIVRPRRVLYMAIDGVVSDCLSVIN